MSARVESWMLPSGIKLSAGRRRALFHGIVLGGLIFFAYIFLVAAPYFGTFGYDAYAYWTVDLSDLYRGTVGDFGFFPYSPPIAVAFLPLAGLPWPAFLVVWYGVLGAALWWLGRRKVLVLLAFPPVAIELYHGNVHLLMAAATVLGFRYPQAWSFILMTKGTSGVGLLWFAARREWRSLAIALGSTAAIVAVTAVLLPAQWLTWLSVLRDNAGAALGLPALPIPIWLRLPAAAAIVWWGAKRDARWTVPVAVTLALPVLWIAGLSVLVGCWPLLKKSHSQRPARHHSGIGARPQLTENRPNRMRRMSAESPRAPHPSVTLVLPAYNEQERIGSALDELFGYLQRTGPPREGGRPASDMGAVEVLVVDDGSSDGTAAIVAARAETARTERPTLRLLREPHTGKGGAVRAGMLAGDSDYIVFADADLATPPDQLPLLTDALDTTDVALGSRVHPMAAIGGKPAAASTDARQGVPRTGGVLGHRPGPRHPVRLQGLSSRSGPRPVQSAEDRQHRFRRRDHSPGTPARILDGDRARPVVRQTRLADARPALVGSSRPDRPLSNSAGASQRPKALGRRVR